MANAISDEESVSITICGDGGCGKSSITLRLVRSQWNNEYDPTIEDSYSVTRVLDGQTYHLHLTDTAGQEEYRGLFGASTLQLADAFLLVYDITSISSLHALTHFLQLIDIETEQRLDRGGIPPIRIVAGNKCDLKNQRQVTAQMGMEWARRNGCMFMETSAREMVNVEETFALLVRRVAQARKVQWQGTTPHAAGRTQPLTPLGEKPDAMNAAQGAGLGGATAVGSGSEEGKKSKKGFWSMLKCW